MSTPHNRMKVGAWIHAYDDVPLGEQVVLAAESGLETIRSYHLGYAEKVTPALKQTGMSLLAGIPVDAAALVGDWRSQVRLAELARYHELGVPLEAICVGNELREGGDDPDKKRFTARLSFGLANVIGAYRQWLDDHGYTTPLTYAMEGIVFDAEGYFYEWLWPLVDACDVVSLNLYPMGNEAWFTFGAFEESRRFLCDARTRHDRLALFELYLRRALQTLERAGKPMILTETGFPSAVGYHLEGAPSAPAPLPGRERKEAPSPLPTAGRPDLPGNESGRQLVIPESDGMRYGEAMGEFAALVHQANADYGGRIRALYFYEWRDNLHHAKIWNVEQSPIHVAFGLCDRFGVPKFPIRELVAALQG